MSLKCIRVPQRCPCCWTFRTQVLRNSQAQFLLQAATVGATAVSAEESNTKNRDVLPQEFLNGLLLLLLCLSIWRICLKGVGVNNFVFLSSSTYSLVFLRLFCRILFLHPTFLVLFLLPILFSSFLTASLYSVSHSLAAHFS